MIGLITAFAPMFLRFVGDGFLERHYNAKVEIAKSETGLKKAQMDADVRRLEHEVNRRALQRDLQLKEMENWWIYFPKAMLMWCTSIYLCAVILSTLFGLKTEYGFIIEDAPPKIWNVMMLVVGYWFLDKAVQHFRK